MTNMENGSSGNYQYKRTWAIWHRLQGQMVVSSMLSLKRWQPTHAVVKQVVKLLPGNSESRYISHELRALGKGVGSRMLVDALVLLDSR